MPTKKTPTSYRLSDRAHEMVADLAARYGASATQIMEIAVRALHATPGPAVTPEAVQAATSEVLGAPAETPPASKRGRKKKDGDSC
jgi:hypothetical protein